VKLDTLSDSYELHYISGLNLELEYVAHPYYEILFVLEGELDINTTDCVYRCKGNVLIMIPPGVRHCNVLVNGSASYTRYIFFFTEAFCTEIPDREILLAPMKNGMVIYELDAQQRKNFQNYFEKLYRNKTHLHARIILQAILFDAGQLGEMRISLKTNRQNYIKAVAEYIAIHYRDKLIAENIARRFGVSRTKLLTDFSRNMPFSFGNYIMRERVNHARKYLKEGRTITETAELCGFSSDTHLRYCFHNIMGMTPSEYRKNGERIKD